METSLRNRLTYGPIMGAAVIGLFVLDWYVQHITRQWGWNPLRTGTPAGIGGVGILVLLLIALPIAVRELATLFTAEKVQPYKLIAGFGAGALALHAFCTQFVKFQRFSTTALALIVVMTMLLAALRRAMARQTAEAITHMAGTVLATLYLGGLAWFLLALRVKQSAYADRYSGSTIIIVMILCCVKFTDIGAYFGGRALGRHKLIPWLSPGKTWEGLFVGILTAGAVGVAFSPWINVPTYQLFWWKGAIFGMIIGGIGQLGDLLESMMKRDAEVKDSGTLVPGFGGILDIIDSPLLAAPFAYVLFSLF